MAAGLGAAAQTVGVGAGAGAGGVLRSRVPTMVKKFNLPEPALDLAELVWVRFGTQLAGQFAREFYSHTK